MIKYMETNNNNNDYCSLYEFLGRAAGSDLGKAVANSAGARKIKINTQEVSNSKYTGKVLTYPRTFLQEYFHGSHTLDVLDSDALPF